MARSAALLLAVALITYPLQSHAGCTPAVSLAVAFLSALPQSFAGSQLAQNWTAASYPNPQVDVTACGRGLKSFICELQCQHVPEHHAASARPVPAASSAQEAQLVPGPCKRVVCNGPMQATRTA